jgi:hypothetical protein
VKKLFFTEQIVNILLFFILIFFCFYFFLRKRKCIFTWCFFQNAPLCPDLLPPVYLQPAAAAVFLDTSAVVADQVLLRHVRVQLAALHYEVPHGRVHDEAPVQVSQIGLRANFNTGRARANAELQRRRVFSCFSG